MTLHSILGIPRVKKRSSSSSAKRNSSPWTSSLTGTKSGTMPLSSSPSPSPSRRKFRNNNGTNQNNNTQVELPNQGPTLPFLPVSLSTLPLRTPLQIHNLILTTMFDPLPAYSAGLGSARISAVLQFRAAVPPVVSASHLRALLLASGVAKSPAAAEREVAGLVRSGNGRRVVIPTLMGRRSSGREGELFVLSETLEGMVRDCRGLGEGVKERFVKWLRANPGRLRVEQGEEGLVASEVDALVRAGFLTAVNGGGGSLGLRARPEERYAMISLESVSRAAAGSVAAAGGEGVLHAAGGTGVRGMAGPVPAGSSEFNVAVPGSGVFVKLVSAALEHLGELLRKTQYREMPESDLREKWDGGIVGESQVAQAKKARGEFTGVMPGRTKKWKELQGLAFNWVLQEAVGAGLVEVLETRSVGRAVRLL
ncbi:hypothetical protein N657DRAFT_77717 [Parathielavia appendiculata]|uniref:Serine-threonine protein kinase 19 n=1 Tax=Parathielavia appendiculata TaxID=2587402 RepID=A0AAN6UB15_9PEZI|nr:hypothetical protein N657DRAFT_77717 [Parathielavia appendiculata]